MIPDPRPNTITRPYRGLSVQQVDLPLTEQVLIPFLLGREVYRRTDYLALRNGTRAALMAVRKASLEPLFSPVVEARLLAGPDQVVWIDSPETDVGNATALARTALTQGTLGRPGGRAYLVEGRYHHVNFIWEPAPVPVRVTEVVPPTPPKLWAMATQVVAFDEDLPPVDLELDVIDLGQLAKSHPAGQYLLPCRGAGVELPAPAEYLDTRPPVRREWLLIGCDRSLQLHRHFYGDEPPWVDICPRRRSARPDGGLTLTKCCLLERGLEVEGRRATVPWGATLDEIRAALRRLTGVEQPDSARVV